MKIYFGHIFICGGGGEHDEKCCAVPPLPPEKWGDKKNLVKNENNKVVPNNLKIGQQLFLG